MTRKLLDKVYMMILPDNGGIVYDVSGTNPMYVWNTVVRSELLGTGYTKEALHKKGYRVKKVEVWL